MSTDKMPPPPGAKERSEEEDRTSFNLSAAVARLAIEAGLSKDAVSRIERGERTARLDTLERLGAAVGLPLPKLVDFGGPASPVQVGDQKTLSLQRLLDQLEPRVLTLVLNLIRGLVRVGRMPVR